MPSVAVFCSSLMSCCGIFWYTIIIMIFTAILIPVSSRSRSWFCGLHLLGLQIRISQGKWMSLSCQCYVLSGRGPNVGLVTLLDSFTECSVCEVDCEESIMRRPWYISGCAPWSKDSKNIQQSLLWRTTWTCIERYEIYERQTRIRDITLQLVAVFP